MQIAMWNARPNFKIKSHQTAQEFMDKVLIDDNRYYIKVSEEKCIYIKKRNNECKVSVKYGDLTDPFNPLIEIPKDVLVSFIYKERKALNNYFFKEEN